MQPFHDLSAGSSKISPVTVIGMMYFLSLVSSLVLFLGRLVLSISIPTDYLDFDPLLFDSTQSSLFLPEDNDFLTTDATLSNPCAAAQDDLSFTEDGGTNLFSRDDHPQCLPPVNIGADALQLFKSPLDSLENIFLPLNGETRNNPPLIEQNPGRLPDGEDGDDSEKNMENQGWQPYAGSVGVETTDDSACKKLTAGLGTYHIELCCNSKYNSRDGQGGLAGSRMGQIDDLTIANQDIAVIYECIFAKTNWACPYLYSTYRICCNLYYPNSKMAYSCIDLSRNFRDNLLL